MGLGEHTITSWDDMRNIFLKKYQAYCRSKDYKDDIFKMSSKEDETLEEYLEIFLYNLQKSKYTSLNLDIIRTIFLKGIQYQYLDVLNVMGKGYMFPTFLLMKLQSCVRSIQEEDMEKGKEISL